HGDAARFGEAGRGDPCVLRVGVDARTYSGSAEGHARQLVYRGFGAADRFLHLAPVALELLAQTYRGRVLKVRAAGLHHRPELLALSLERSLQALERRDE